MVKNYVPHRGDIVWLDFAPQTGHEQTGRIPALVISHEKYNEKVGLAIFCPITSAEKGYPFEVKLSSEKINGVVLSDQIKSLDWRERNAKFIETCSETVLIEVLEKISVLI